MKKQIIIAFGLAFLLAGCIPSIHPLYTEDTLIIRNDLLGRWSGDHRSGEVWDFRLGEGKLYDLYHTDGQGRMAHFEVGMVKLGEHYFLDFYPGDQTPPEENSDHPAGSNLLELNELMENHLLPVHTFVRLQKTEEGFLLEWLWSEWLDNLLEEDRIRIRYEKSTDDMMVLTASTRELQQFLTKYGSEDRAFSELTTLTPVRD